MRCFFRVTLGTMTRTAREITLGRLTIQYAAPCVVAGWWRS
jgi:hypothetical protein